MKRSDFRRIYAAVTEGRSESLCVEAGDTVCVRNFLPRERVIVLGAGHVAQPVCTFAAAVGFSVTVVDDRPDFACRERFPEAEEVICDSFDNAIRGLHIGPCDYVCIITRGHRWDGECLRAVLDGSMPHYVGMIGSRKRTAAMLEILKEEGYAPERIAAVHTPIGEPIGALTVPEIGISIVAQLIRARREDLNRGTSKSNVLTTETSDLKLLQFLAETEEPATVIMICRTEGSSPAKSGALMAVTGSRRQAGTIGGGSGENACMQRGYALAGTGGREMMTVDMNHDVAADEGMVCGGTMQVLLCDLELDG